MIVVNDNLIEFSAIQFTHFSITNYLTTTTSCSGHRGCSGRSSPGPHTAGLVLWWQGLSGGGVVEDVFLQKDGEEHNEEGVAGEIGCPGNTGVDKVAVLQQQGEGQQRQTIEKNGRERNTLSVACCNRTTSETSHFLERKLPTEKTFLGGIAISIGSSSCMGNRIGTIRGRGDWKDFGWTGGCGSS